MFKKAISGLSIIAAAFGLAAFSAPASADCVTDDAGWDCLSISGTDYAGQGEQGPLVYSGPAALSHWLVGTLNCTLTAEGYAEVASGQVTIRVTDLQSSGSSSCGRVSFGNLPLVFDSAPDTLPTTDTSNGSLVIHHDWMPNLCSGTIDLTFDNDGMGGSVFSFNQSLSGGCGVNGSLTNGSVWAW